MKKHILSLFVAISLVACSNDDTTVTEQPANYSTGYLVTNEGNFNSNNADITYINANFTDSQNQIFRNVNNRALGDVAQSITQNANYVFVVMNNSNTIEVVNKNTFESVATISENINQPRYATITDNKLWVTNAGNNTISSYNLSDFTPSETISLNFTPELIDSTTDYIYVTTNPWADTHLIVPYSTDTHQPTLTTTLDAPVNGLVKQNDQIFVLSSGENFTQIYKVTSHTSYVMSQNEDTNSRFLSINGNKLYYTSGVAIKEYDMTSQTLSTLFSVPDTGWSAIYGFNVFDQHFFVADAKSFTEAGEVIIYNAGGNPLKTIKTGIGPNGIFKIQ